MTSTTSPTVSAIVCLGSYENGCYCTTCRVEAFADGVRVVEMPADEHGTVEGYLHWHCRCSPCRGAHREAQREWRAARAQPGRRTYRELPPPPLVEDGDE